jgi:hypothetical protein
MIGEGSCWAKRFNELPKLDHFLRPAAVAVIAIPLAFRRAARAPCIRHTRKPRSASLRPVRFTDSFVALTMTEKRG